MTQDDSSAHGTIAGFTDRMVATEHGDVFLRVGGSGPVVLLLHGFPETGMMWHAVVPWLADDYTVVVADPPGYGRSACPSDVDDHYPMSKRALARTLVAAMGVIGQDRFAVVGHDRGGRVAYRAALDHPAVVTAVAVLDVVPTADVWDRADARLTLGFWPFSLLAQPAPLPERLIAGDPKAVVDDALSNWGTPPETFPDWLRDIYVAMLEDPEHTHAICEEYRAAATIDRSHDNADRASGHHIACPLLALWSAHGGLATWYETDGGPLGLWRRWAHDVRGRRRWRALLSRGTSRGNRPIASHLSRQDRTQLTPGRGGEAHQAVRPISALRRRARAGPRRAGTKESDSLG